ncbi:MAG: flagellar protein FlaG [Wenzhouxiangellaceae bacterium]|nr:flagellar protein FlaG [Wenzhouxiangellaceae bacterium]
MEGNIQISAVQSQPAQDSVRRPEAQRANDAAASRATPLQPALQTTDVALARAPEPAGVGESLRDELQGVAERLGDFARENARELEFRVDGEADKVVIEVRNPETGEVLRTIPPEEADRIAANLNEGASALLSQIA